MAFVADGGGKVVPDSRPPPAPPKQAPPPPPAPAGPALLPYNPGGYVPGGSSEKVAKAIEEKALSEPGPHPVYVPRSILHALGSFVPPPYRPPGAKPPPPLAPPQDPSAAQKYGTEAAAGPFAGAGVMVGSTEASWQAAIANAKSNGGTLDWVAFPPGVPPEVIAQARAAGLTIIAWQPPETVGTTDPAQLVAQYGAAGYIGQAESQAQWNQATKDVGKVDVPTAIVTNEWAPGGYGKFPPGTVAMPELYAQDGQQANFNALANFKGEGAVATVPLLGIYSDAHDAPGTYRKLNGLGLPGVGGYIGEDTPTDAGIAALGIAAGRGGQPQPPKPPAKPGAPAGKQWCFEWGGEKWGGDFAGKSTFVAWLRAHGQDPDTWAFNHPLAAQCIGLAVPGTPQFVPPPPSPPPPTVPRPTTPGTPPTPPAKAQPPPPKPPVIPAGKLDHVDLETLWDLAGGPPEVSDVAAAIAQAESSGEPWRINNTAYPNRPNYHPPGPGAQPEYSVGLWQINMLAHPSYSEAELLTPLANARAAVAISDHGKSFHPWSTYTSGAYKRYLSGGTTPPPPPIPAPSSPTPRAPGVQAAWGGLVDLAAVSVPRQRHAVKSLADSLVKVFQ